MSYLQRFSFGSFGLVAVMAACSSGGSSGSASSACSSITTALEQACGYDLFGGVQTATQASEVACAESSVLPGSPSAAAYAACANAITASGCADGTAIAECDLRGTLAGGTDCNEDVQCASGSCHVPAGATCGTCDAVIADGQPCTTGGCRAGAACVSGTCAALTYGSVGAECDLEGTALCASDLYCDLTTRKCSTLPTNGQACGRAGVGSAICAPPYVCNETGTSRTCVLGNGVGQACPCATGLYCTTDSDGGAGVCATLAAPGPGEPCSTSLAAACATGACDTQTMTCPQVLADGQACTAGSASAVCSDVSSCVSGVCTSVAATVAVCK